MGQDTNTRTVNKVSNTLGYYYSNINVYHSVYKPHINKSTNKSLTYLLVTSLPTTYHMYEQPNLELDLDDS